MALGILRRLEVMEVFRGWVCCVPMLCCCERILAPAGSFFSAYTYLLAPVPQVLDSPLDRNTVVVSDPWSGLTLVSLVLTSYWPRFVPVSRHKKHTQSIVMRFLPLLQHAFCFLHGYRVLQLVCQEPTWTSNILLSLLNGCRCFSILNVCYFYFGLLTYEFYILTKSSSHLNGRNYAASFDDRF